MKQFLFFLALLFCGIPAYGQKDLDFSFTTSYLTLFTQKVDSVATAAKAKAAKAGTKVETVLNRDTVTVKEGGLRYLTKQNNAVTIYDPNNPTGATTYELQFAGWLKGVPNPLIKYNMLQGGKVFGALTVDLFSQEFYISTPLRQILYTNRE